MASAFVFAAAVCVLLFTGRVTPTDRIAIGSTLIVGGIVGLALDWPTNGLIGFGLGTALVGLWHARKAGGDAR